MSEKSDFFPWASKAHLCHYIADASSSYPTTAILFVCLFVRCFLSYVQGDQLNIIFSIYILKSKSL